MNMQKKIEVIPPSCMSIYTEMMFNTEKLATCTSFIVQCNEKFHLITNRHNLTGRDNYTDECLDKKFGAVPNKMIINFQGRGLEDQIIPYRCTIDLFNEDKNIWLEHPKFGGKVDIGAIELPYDGSIEYHAYVLRDDFDIRIQPSDRLNVIGFPFGKSQINNLAIWSTGFMASDYQVDYEDLPVFLIDCRTRQGQSGSPVIIHRSTGDGYMTMNGAPVIIRGSKYKLFGVYSGRIREDSDLGYVWKIKAIEDIILQRVS